MRLHSLLQYGHHGTPTGPYCPLLWDLRNPPSFCSLHTGRRVSTFALSQVATSPPVQHLTIMCEIFPFHWPIVAHNERGVTVADILQAIFHAARRRLLVDEWNMLAEKQHDRILRAYEARWRMSPWAEWERINGLVRCDCLMGYTRFAGLSIIPTGPNVMDFVCIMTLSRNSFSP